MLEVFEELNKLDESRKEDEIYFHSTLLGPEASEPVNKTKTFPYIVIKTEYTDKKEALVVAGDTNLSLAIGRKGQNVKLASRLTHYKIEVKSEEAMAQLENNSEVAEITAEPVVEPSETPIEE